MSSTSSSLYLKARKKLNTKQVEMVASIKLYGGKIDDKVTVKTDYLIVCEDLKYPAPADVIAADKAGVAIVSEKWVAKSVISSKKLDTTGFIVDLPKAPKKKEEAEEKEEKEEKKEKESKDDKKKKNGKKGSKRKAEDDEEEEEKPKASKKKKTDDKPPSDPNVPVEIVEATSLQPGSEWMGVCTYQNEGEHFPFVLEVTKTDNDKIEGFVYWKTLNDSQTKFRGTVKNGELKLEEYEVVQGVDEVEIPAFYAGKLVDTTATGTVGDAANKVTFKMDRVKAPQQAELVVPSKWKGECTSSTGFVLVVETRTDKDALTGTLKYPSLNAVTRWKGKVAGSVLELEEYEVVKGDENVVILKKWKGTLDNGQMSGSVGSDASFVFKV